MDKNNLKKGLTPKGVEALSDDQLEQAAGGLRAPSGKWIVTPDYGCMHYKAREGLDQRYIGVMKCKYCAYRGWESAVISVCENPSNT